jgi:hypothetical protein
VAPTEVAKIIVENLGQHEMIEKVGSNLMMIKIDRFHILFFLRLNIPDQVL